MLMNTSAWNISLDWTEDEQRALETCMQRFPPDRFDSVQRCVKTAAMLPRKSVRDVALRMRWSMQQQSMRKQSQLEPSLASMVGYKKAHRPPLPMPMVPPPPVPPFSGLLPGTASAVGAGQGVDGPIGMYLEHNYRILNQFRENMGQFKVHENTQLLVQFRDNIIAIINAMEAMGGVMGQMPALPCRLNVDLANNFLPSRPTTLTSLDTGMMAPPQPAMDAPGMVPLTNIGVLSNSGLIQTNSQDNLES